MIDLFLKYIEYEKRYSQHTLTSYKTDLQQFSEYLSTTYQLADAGQASYSLIRDWISNLASNDITAKSINRKIASLRSFYKFLLKKGVISKDPTLKIKAPKIRKRLPIYVEEKDMNHLLDHIDFKDDFEGLRDKLVIELLYGTGIRLSELINLKESDINSFDETIKVLGKGNKQRIIPLNKTLFNLINLYKKKKRESMELGDDHLILTDTGSKPYPMLIQRIVKKYLNAGITIDGNNRPITTIEKKSPHVLRHSFATHLLNKGADLNAIKDLLGHSSLAATQVYTHNSIEKLKEIFNNSHPKSGKKD
jgi:integrase/recombinase XerC